MLAVEGEGGPVRGWGTRALAGDNEFAPQTLPLLLNIAWRTRAHMEIVTTAQLMSSNMLSQTHPVIRGYVSKSKDNG